MAEDMEARRAACERRLDAFGDRNRRPPVVHPRLRPPGVGSRSGASATQYGGGHGGAAGGVRATISRQPRPVRLPQVVRHPLRPPPGPLASSLIPRLRVLSYPSSDDKGKQHHAPQIHGPYGPGKKMRGSMNDGWRSP
ncbi:hypothetical protein ZWY2020_040401 [Hordeum vulgare]|nr:hypothetical protein ZWY2020_040401 [Hordeum vulgare]